MNVLLFFYYTLPNSCSTLLKLLQIQSNIKDIFLDFLLKKKVHIKFSSNPAGPLCHHKHTPHHTNTAHTDKDRMNEQISTEFNALLQRDSVALQSLALKLIVTHYSSLFLTLDYSAGMCKLCVITPALKYETKWAN